VLEQLVDANHLFTRVSHQRDDKMVAADFRERLNELRDHLNELRPHDPIPDVDGKTG
jgi:hypothetical protein